MNTKYIFPLLLIALDVGAAIVYGVGKDFKMATYWIAAAVLNICVTFLLGGERKCFTRMRTESVSVTSANLTQTALMLTSTKGLAENIKVL